MRDARSMEKRFMKYCPIEDRSNVTRAPRGRH